VLNETIVLSVLVGTIIDWKESILMMKCENVNLMFARLSLYPHSSFISYIAFFHSCLVVGLDLYWSVLALGSSYIVVVWGWFSVSESAEVLYVCLCVWQT
jgi:hypothetical protein